MKVSIITASYNRSTTIIRSISSVKQQLYRNTQCVIVDGNSSDDTLAQIQPLLSSQDIVISEPDNGIYDALNKGIEIATGEIIGFLHSDDLYFDNNVLAIVAEAFRDEKVNVVYGDVCFFAVGKLHNVIRRYRSPKLTKKSLAWGKMPAHPAMFIRRSVFADINHFSTDFKIAADYEFMCRLAGYKNLKSVYLPLIFVRMQLGGVSTQGIRSTITLNLEVLKALKQNGIYSNVFMILSKYPSKILEFFKK